MHHILVLGAGRIGRLIACSLTASGDYQVTLADANVAPLNHNIFGELSQKIKVVQLDAADTAAMVEALQQHQCQAVISCLPYYCNPRVADAARLARAAYFDLTEDTTVTAQVVAHAKDAKQAFVPQCGLAPGFISIVAHHLMQAFDEVEQAYLRVGALPVHPNNALKYNLTWSTEGLINECGNPCHGIQDGQAIQLQPLEGLETIQIDGLAYEAFNTSGGLGSLTKTYAGKVKTLNYKSLRYPGHCQAMRLLMNDLKLNQDRETFKTLLERAIPATDNDVVLVYVAVNGYIKGRLTEKTYVNKVYPQTLAGQTWSAIQVTTANSACAIIDEVLSRPTAYQGYVTQERFDFETFINNRFGRVYS